MRRRRGMGILFEYMFSTGCLLGMNFVFIFLFSLIRNLPNIFRVSRHVLREILKLTYRVYKPVITHLPQVVQQYCWVKIQNSPKPIIATTLISILLLLVLGWILNWGISIFSIILATLHGGTVGFLWDGLDQVGSLHTGEKIE